MPQMIKQTAMLSQVMIEALSKAEEARFEFLTPELFFYYGVLQQKLVTDIWEQNNIDVKKFRRELKRHIDQMERVPKDIDYKVMPSVSFCTKKTDSLQYCQSFFKQCSLVNQ